MEYPHPHGAARGLRPGLAMMAALLDDWALPFGARRPDAAPGRGPRGAGLTFPKWLLSGDLDDDDDDDDDDARPVLRRSRSTWATWPSGSQEEDGVGQAEDAADAAWWTAAGPRRRPRSWAPRHPRDRGHDRDEQEPRTPRGGSRRYFDYTPRRDGRDGRDSNADALHGHHQDRSRQRSSSAHNPSQRVAFSDAVGGGGRPAYRDVPIVRDVSAGTAGTARGRAGSRRDEKPPVVSRDVPVTTAREGAARDLGTTATVRNIPVTREDAAHAAPPTATPQAEQPATPSSPPRSRNIRIELSDSHPDLHAHGLRASVRVEADAAPAREAPAHDKPMATAEGEACWPRRVDQSATARDVEPDLSSVSLRLLQDERRRCAQLQEENTRLKAVITTIQETNARWQGFNAARQAYIQRLLSTIEEQQTQLNACLEALKATPPSTQPPMPAPAQQQAPQAQQAQQATPAFASSLSDRDLLEAERAEARLRGLQREVSDLHRRLQEAKREHRETVTMLQSQDDSLHDEPSRTDRASSSTTPATSAAQPSTQRVLAAHRDRGSSCCCSGEAGLAGLAERLSLPAEATPPLPRASDTTASPTQAAERPSRRYFDVVMDSASHAEHADAADGATRPASPPVTLERTRTAYSFDGDALLQQQQQQQQRQQQPCRDARHASPALSDALTPTPSPLPAHHHDNLDGHHRHREESGCYPIELSGSASSLGSGPAPHIDVPSSSRATTPDLDVSMCSDATLDCSPPSPVQTCTPGTASSAGGRADPFRWLERGVGLRLF